MGKISTLTGYIGTTSYRPDSIFSDQIHEGDITDLRSSAHDTNDMEVMNSVFNGAISGSERGSEGEWEMHGLGLSEPLATSAGISQSLTVVDTSKINAGDIVRHGLVLNLYVESVVSSTLINVRQIGLTSWTRTLGNNTVVYGQSTRKKSNTMTHCDIIGKIS